MASATDYFQKVGRSTATTLSSPGYTIGDTSINVASTTNWPVDTGVTFAIDVVGSDGLRVSGSYNVFRGVVSSATQVSSVTYVGGDANRDYTSGATTRVYILVSAYRDNRFTDGLLVQHKNTGAHKDVTADSLVVSGTSTLGAVTATSLTLSGTASAEGWSPLGATPNTVTANGNNSFDLVFNGTDLTDTITEGMRIRTARTVTAPIQCATFDGTNDYFSKSSPAGMTFTDDFVVSAWVKLSSYPTIAAGIASRYNGTSGWQLDVDSSGRVRLIGYNNGVANISYVMSYQSIPLNKWVHIAAQLDMSAFSATTTTSYIMLDGVDVPAQALRGGTNPTSLVQAGNLEIGSYNGGTSPFPGKIAQVAIYSAKVTQATIKASMNQGLTGSETSLVSAYSLSNSLEDLSANNNDLTANGGVLATTTDSPFGNSGVSTTLDYGVVMAKSFSTNTTLTVQVPEGCTIPTSGGVSSVDYSTQSVPYGFPRDKGRWSLYCKIRSALTNTSSATYVAFSGNAISLTVPSGSWKIAFQFNGIYSNTTTAITSSISPTSLVGLGVGSYSDLSFRAVSTGAVSYAIAASGQTFRNISTAEKWVLYTIGAATIMGIDGSSTINELYAENAYI